MYHVSVSREDGFWVAVVDGVVGGATEARRLSALDTEVRDLLAGLLGVDDESLELEYDFAPALGMAADDLDRYREAREALDHARREYEDAQARTAGDLRAEGVSLRDSAELLDISFQRVQQLVS